MPKVRLATIGVLAAFATGCSGADAAQPAPAATVTVAASPQAKAEASTAAEPKGLKVGQVRRFDDADSTGTVAVLKVQQPFPSQFPPDRAGYEFAGVEIRRCFKTITAPGGLTVGWGPWTLGYKNGNTIEPPSSWSADHFSVPLYPRDKPVRAGRCIRGWIPYEVPKGTKPTDVTYTLDATDTQPAVQVEWATR